MQGKVRCLEFRTLLLVAGLVEQAYGAGLHGDASGLQMISAQHILHQQFG